MSGREGRIQHPARVSIGLIVVGSLVTGLVAALAVVVAPFIEANEIALTGGVLLAFGFGWALLALLSVRFSDQPQWWAAAPAVFFGLIGGLMLAWPSGFVLEILGWVWPPALLGLVVVMIIGAHRRLRSRTRQWLVYPLLAVLTLAALGGGYETVRESIDASAHPMAGQLIDVGGRRLHLQCAGSGSPTVVLEPGLGEASYVMGWITPAVAADSRVCVYDRAGRGWSDSADSPLDGAQIAADLHTLLDRAHVPGPYVLAGHSFGGLYILTFAAHYPDEVAGMVLLDSTSPNGSIQATSTEPGSYDLSARFLALLPAAAHLGLARLVTHATYGSLPPPSRGEARAAAATARDVKSFIDELISSPKSIQQAASLVDFGDKPLIVVTAGRGHDAQWMAAQDKLVMLSTNSQHRVVHDATHGSLVLVSTDAAAATDAIREVVASVRNSSPLH